jgi:hypothetical protein
MSNLKILKINYESLYFEKIILNLKKAKHTLYLTDRAYNEVSVRRRQRAMPGKTGYI